MSLPLELPFFAAGGTACLFFQAVGFDSVSAGIWSQALLIAGLVGWTLTYLFRIMSKNMTYDQQVKDYEDAVLQKRLEAMTPEELKKLQQETAQDQSTID